VSNGYGPHDVGQVVRSTLHNHPVNLTAGETTPLYVSGTVSSGWNPLNLSVVTFIQNNSSKIIQNANMAPVTTLNTVVSENVTTVLANRSSTVTIHVTNTSTGAPVVGANVTFTSDSGGSFVPSSGATLSGGTFSAKFIAPYVTSTTNVQITAKVSEAGYTDGTATTMLTVNPVILPDAPTSLLLAPGISQVSLNWSAPASGGAGLTYHVFRSSTVTGPFSDIGTVTSPGYVDAGLAGGHAYWYKVSAQNTYGFSVNTTTITATGATASTQGLPDNVGWWISIDRQTFNSSTNGTMVIFLPNGLYTYVYGPASYAYVASSTGSSVTVSGLPFSIGASFAPRYASLQGTVSPASATVTVNGVAVTVSSGGFAELLQAGTYTINVSATGYVSNVSSVPLTPGNLTTLAVTLTPIQSGSGSGTAASGAITTDQAVAVIAVIAVVLVVAGLVLTSKKGKRDQSP